MERPIPFSGKCRLIASDIDNTFTTSKKDSHPENMAAIREAAAQGIPFIFASGRSWGGIVKWVRELDLTAPQVLNNGATIILPKTEETLLSIPIVPQLAELAYRGFMEQGFLPVVSVGNSYLAEAEESETRWMLLRNQEGYTVTPHDVIMQLIQDGKVEKMGVISPEREQELKEYTEEMMADAKAQGLLCDYGFTERGIMVLVSGKTTKLSGIDFVCQRLGCTLADVLAVGDGDNDAAMLAGVGCGVAVANATPKTKAAALHVVTDNDHAGLAEAIRKYAL